MKISKKNNGKNEKPRVITDLNGNVISINESAKSELDINKKTDIAKIIDADLIKKLSMMPNGMKIAKTTNKKYKEAILRANGVGISKTVQITFNLGYEKDDQDVVQEENMLSFINTNDETVTNFNCISMSNEIVDQVQKNSEENPPYINNYSKNEDFYHKPSVVQILSACSIGIANEISPTKPVSFSIRKILHLLQIETKVAVNTLKTANTQQDIESIYPFIATKLAMIDELCEKENISYESHIKGRFMTFRFLLEERKPTAELHAVTFFTTILASIAKAFAPRKGIRTKYGMPEVTLEEQ